MSPFRRFLRQTLAIARRDLTATVMTPTFLLFLLSPLLMIGFGIVGNLSAKSALDGSEAKQRLVVLAPAAQEPAIRAADKQLRAVFPSSFDRPPLRIDPPATDPARQARALFDESGVEVSAVLYGSLDRPQVLRASDSPGDGRYMVALAEQIVRVQRSGGAQPLTQPSIDVVKRGQPSSTGKSASGYFAALGIFFLTLMLSGQAVGAMAEERSNKVIEVLAAAVPLESVFFGKLLGAFGSALLFIGFWGTLLANLPKLLPPGSTAFLSELGTATGPLFALLFVGYFTMAYLLQSAVFLGLGSLASTQREIQMLSLPITIFQFGMLGLGSYAGSHPDSWISRVAEIFPFSSPLAMAARAATMPELWPHLLALAWQALWVAATITIAARLFRRGVLKSGGPKRAKKAVVA